MFLKIFHLFLQYLCVAHAQDNRIIRDYFIHKKVTAVVGFSCENITSDFQLTRMLNDEGIAISTKGPMAEFNFSRFLHADYWKLGVFVDLRCQKRNATTIFDQSTGHYMYDYTYNWFILTRNISDCLHTLNDTAFSVVTDFVVSVPNNDHYDLYDIYNPTRVRGGKLNITKYATWKENTGLDVLLLQAKILRRWNLHKIKINVASAILNEENMTLFQLEWKPENVTLLEYIKNHDVMSRDVWPTIGFALLTPLSDIFNFSMNVRAFTNWTNYNNGPLIDALNEGSVDLGYQPSLILHKRLDLAKVMMEILPVRTCFMYVTLPSTKIQTSSVLRPLAWSSWYMIVLLFLISFFVFVFILKSEHLENHDYGNSLLTILGSLCQQGAQSVPYKLASRIAFFQIGLYSLLIYNYYSAAIVSARLNLPLSTMNDSLYTLLASKMKLASEKTLLISLLVQDSNPEMVYFAKRWKQIPTSKSIIDVEEGVARMMQERFAYHSVPENAYTFINKYFDQKMICQLTEIHWLRPTRAALYANRRGHFVEIGKIGLMKIFSTGLLRRELRRSLARKPYCRNDMTSIESVTIYEAAPIILFLMCGMILSIVICFIENVVFYLNLTQPKQLRIFKKYKRQSNTVVCLKLLDFFKKKEVTIRTKKHDCSANVTN